MSDIKPLEVHTIEGKEYFTVEDVQQEMKDLIDFINYGLEKGEIEEHGHITNSIKEVVAITTGMEYEGEQKNVDAMLGQDAETMDMLRAILGLDDILEEDGKPKLSIVPNGKDTLH